MIVGDWFESDDMDLAWIQHDCYWYSLKILFRCLENRLEGLAPELTPFFPISSFDHRDMQGLHDLLAARFRLAWLRQNNKTVKQITLFGEDEVVDAREFQWEWGCAIHGELDDLLTFYPNTVRYVFISVLWPNPDKRGIGAENAFFREVISPERDRLRCVTIMPVL